MTDKTMMEEFTNGNKDDIHAAIDALNAFTKNWCMNCEETEKTEDLVFRCDECIFHKENKHCLIKVFCIDKDRDYMSDIDFGCMGML